MESKFAPNLFGGASSEKDFVSAMCPNCGNRLEFCKSDRSVSCFCCDSSFLTANLLDKPQNTGISGNSQAHAEPSAVSIAQLIDSPDAGLVYIQNRFDNLEWDNYCESLEIILPEIEEMVEKSKIKYGATASAWLLDFESIAVPLDKKLCGLRKMAEKMAEQYSDIDNTGILDTFDLYRDITEVICDEKAALIRRLENAVVYAERFSLESSALEKMKASLESLKERLDATEPVKKPADIPELKQKQNELDEEKIKDFAARGLAVREIYQSACDMMDDPAADKNETLRMLQTIRGYSDVNDRIDALNRYYNFHNEYYSFCGKSFVFKARKKEAIFDPKKEKKKKKKNYVYKPEDEFSGTVLALYEVVDLIPSAKPIVDNITQILTVYANRLYYIKLDAAICYFDIVTKVEYTVDSGRVGDYRYDKIYPGTDKTHFFIRKRLPLEVIKAGCVKKLLFSEKDEALERRNNYSLLKVSLLTGDVTLTSTAISELVDVTEFYGNTLFYTKAEEIDFEALKNEKKSKKKKKKKKFNDEPEEEEEIKTTFRVHNIDTGEDKALLDNNCELHGVIDGNVIFSKYVPNELNKDLYVYSIATNTETLIEHNIRDFLTLIKGRIYYSVGNEDYCPLFSNDLNGDDRVEIMKNVENIVAVRAGWMYVIKGYGRNAILIKVSGDGKRRMVVCTQFKTSIKITDSYIYYLDTANSLRVVRTDGKDNLLIADNISENSVIVDKDRIYYLREELVDTEETAASLYSMDISGHNVRKLVFNVSLIDNFDDDNIIISRNESATFELSIPIDKKNNVRKERRYYNLRHFCKYNKNTGAMETLMTLGMPNSNEYEFSKGCFGKKVKYTSAYKRIPEKIVYNRKNVAKAGAAMNEQASAQGVGILDAEKLTKKGCGKRR